MTAVFIALLSHSFGSVIICITVTVSYLLFYTAYDKQSKNLTTKNLIDLVTLRRGLDWTLVEINKAISLSGLTTLLMSFLPFFKIMKNELLFISMNILWVHSIYSMYKFYGYSLKRVMNDVQIKQISIVLGISGQYVIAAGYYGLLSYKQLIFSGIN